MYSSTPIKLAGPVIRVPYPFPASDAPPSLHAAVTVGEVAFATGAASKRQDSFAGRKRSIFTLPVILLPDGIAPKDAVAVSLDNNVRLSLVVMPVFVTAPYTRALEINRVSAGVAATAIPLVLAFIREEIVLFTNQLPEIFWAAPDVPFISTI